jgi:hypothetical protein
MAALVGSLAMLVVATLLTVGSGSVTATRTPDRSITSADVLELAAHGVNNQPALAARPDQYIYTESVAVFLEMPRADGPMTFSPRTEVRQWRAVDGTREGLRQTRPLDDPDAAWQSTPLAGCVKSGDCAMFSSGSIDLPADADKTYEYLYQRLPDDATTGIDADERALSRAAQLLYLSQHSPAVQAVVFEAVGRIPGMRVRLDAADVMGRAESAWCTPPEAARQSWSSMHRRTDISASTANSSGFRCGEARTAHRSRRRWCHARH